MLPERRHPLALVGALVGPGVLALVALVSGVQAVTTDGSGGSGGSGGSSLPGAPLEVAVVSSDWNGWEPDHVPTPETTTFPAVEGTEARIEGLGEDVHVLVTEVGADGVVLELDSPLSPRSEGGGLDLDDPQDVVEVGLEKPVELGTPTLDAGVTYVVSLVER
jgi:hypothetical protein